MNGLVRLRPGDVLRHQGGLYIVDYANECRARAVPLNWSHVALTTRFDKSVEFDAPGKRLNVSTSIDPEQLVERRGTKGLDNFLAAKKAGRRNGTLKTPAGNSNGNMIGKPAKNAVTMGDPAWSSIYSGTPAPKVSKQETQPTEKDMGKTKRSKRTTAERKPRKAKAESNGDNSRYDKIMGNSVCSVVRRLGMEDVSFGHAKAILAANGVTTMTDKSLRVQLWFGKNHKKSIAKLTMDQVKELKASAAEPVEQPKEEVKAT